MTDPGEKLALPNTVSARQIRAVGYFLVECSLVFLVEYVSIPLIFTIYRFADPPCLILIHLHKFNPIQFQSIARATRVQKDIRTLHLYRAHCSYHKASKLFHPVS
jgi:hypothetical protein